MNCRGCEIGRRREGVQPPAAGSLPAGHFRTGASGGTPDRLGGGVRAWFGPARGLVPAAAVLRGWALLKVRRLVGLGERSS